MGKGRLDGSAWKSLMMVSQFGFTMLAPMVMMFALGYFLDRFCGTGFWAVLLFFVGALAGAGNVYRLARRIFRGHPHAAEDERDGSG